MEIIKDWLIPISTFVTLISTSVGIWLSLKQYRVKLNTEARLNESARAENDIKLLTSFTDILVIATGRRNNTILSDQIVTELIKQNLVSGDINDYQNLERIRVAASKAAILEPMVGYSSTTAAFASIATLAKRHEMLRPSALQALEDFRGWNQELADKYIHDISEHIKREKTQVA
jgi:hypothetical protein